MASSAALTSTTSIVAETTNTRFLRVGKTSNTDRYASKGIDRNFVVDDTSINNPEERGGWAGALEKLKSLKIIKSVSRSVSKTTNLFSDKISPALSLKSKLQVWSNNKKSVSFVRKELGMEGLDDVELTQVKNFKFYDDYVTSQLPVWSKKELTPDEVVSELGLRGLSGAELMSNPNFKYYDEYLVQQALVWAKKDVDVDVVLKRLGLDTMPAATRPEAVSYKYYEEFVAGLMRSWMEKEVPVTEVMAKFKLDKLTGQELLNHPNYKYYKNYVKNNLKAWAGDLKSYEYVVEKLGLKGPRGKLLDRHSNFVFLKKFGTHADKYREQLWLKQSVTSYDAWKRLGVDRVRETMRKSSDSYVAYKNYVNLIDDYIVDLKIKEGVKDENLPRLTSNDASELELHEKTLIWEGMKRPEWYVKFSLELDGLKEAALKKAANYQHYKHYLDAKNAVKHT
ncbi:hypothetical protein PC119_g11961 [Phytophthora cactorum]|nr:hypothetical protein PC112_g18268 [Phytophthora cactorum]KAG3014919.1 hypothetical protein PC119_g11961 [Phytophthora cactorum]